MVLLLAVNFIFLMLASGTVPTNFLFSVLLLIVLAARIYSELRMLLSILFIGVL